MFLKHGGIGEVMEKLIVFAFHHMN